MQRRRRSGVAQVRYSGVDEWALGIDVGTSRSAGATANGSVSPLEVEGNRWMSSMVLLDPSGRLIVGVAADDQAEIHPDRIERTPKRHLGGGVPMLLGDTPVAAEDAVARLIEVFLAEGRLRHDGRDPSATVLTHPVRWGDRRKRALVDAAGRAGLAEPLLFSEPVAAAVHYVDERVEVGGFVGIYDLGGGTFDTAVLQRTDDGFAVVGAPGGDEFIGGEHFDHLVVDYLGACLADIDAELWENIQFGEDRRWIRAAADLTAQARRAKEAVSSYPSIQVLLPMVDRDVVFTRRQFEEMVRDQLEITVTAMAATIDSAGMTSDDLDAIYLVGGSSRIPLVTELMTARFGDRIATRDEPKSVVALGAATCARAVQGGSGRFRTVGSEPTGVVTTWRFDVGTNVHGLAADATGIWVTAADATLHRVGTDGVWRSGVQLSGVAYGPPVPADGRVYVGTADHAVSAVDARTGTGLWRAATRAPVIPAPLATGEVVVAVDDEATVAAFDRSDGTLRWLLPLGTNARAPLVAGSGMVLVAGLDGRVFRVDPATGRVSWAFPAPESVTSAPLLVGDLGVVATTGGVVYGLEPGPGTARWGKRLDAPVDGPVAAHGRHVLVADRSGGLTTIDTADGTILARADTGGPNPTGVVVVDGHAVVDNGAGSLLVIAPATGRVVGHVGITPGTWQPPVVHDDLVIVPSGTSIVAVRATF